VSLSATAKWVLLALAGLAIAIGIAIAAANLTSRQIGIASESVSAGDALAPALNIPGKAKPQESGGGSGEEGTPTAPSFPAPATVTEEPTFPPEETTGTPDDRGGGGSGDSDGDDD
jgi:hypothetical protein